VPISDAARILELREQVRQVRVSDEVESYVTAITRGTRISADIEVGASPRATVALYRASQALAVLEGRSYVLPDDVKELAPAVLEHRVTVDLDRAIKGVTAATAIAAVLGTTPAPPLATS
jgi:MoxR-like ATPase